MYTFLNGGERTLYPNQYVEYRLNGVGPTGSFIKYYFVGNQRLAMKDTAGMLRFFINDHLGSTSLTLNSNGSVYSEQRYKPYGDSRYSTTTVTPTQYRFTGQMEDMGTGLYFYNARYYDPAPGRFTQADTIVPNPNNGQSLNRYTYVSNNPIKYTDPSGHCPAPPADSGNVICVDWFIPTDTILGFTGKGDGRGFDSNSDPSRSRAYTYIYLDSDNKYLRHEVYINSSEAFGSSFGPYPNDNSVTVTQDAKTGNLTVTWSLQNGASSYLQDLGDNMPSPGKQALDGLSNLLADINGTLTLSNIDGKWVPVYMNRDPYPRLESYFYQNGAVQYTILQRYAFGEVEYDAYYFPYGPPLLGDDGFFGPLIGLASVDWLRLNDTIP